VLQNLVGEAFAVAVDFPVARAPALQEAEKVGPGQGIQCTPIGFKCLEVDDLFLLVQRSFKCLEIEIEQGGFLPLALIFRKAAADKLGDVLHAASAADILEIDGCDSRSII
jgi:hypothetical protein